MGGFSRCNDPAEGLAAVSGAINSENIATADVLVQDAVVLPRQPVSYKRIEVSGTRGR